MISTKKGDRGESFIKGKKYPKDSLFLETLGDLDELMSWLGLVRVELKKKEDKELVFLIQKDLQGIAAVVAGYQKGFSSKRVGFLEKTLEERLRKLPQIRGFVVPGENRISALLHLARTVCRRAERRAVALSKEKKIPGEVLQYLNRLSDLLFVLAFALGHTNESSF